MRKILVVCGFRIFPCNTGGHLRTGNMVRALARMGHQVTVFSLAGRQEDYGQRPAEGFRIDHIESNLTEHVDLGMTYGLMQAVGRRLGLPRVWQYWMLKHGLVPRRLRQAIAEADVVLSDLPWAPPVDALLAGKRWYLISHNLEYRLLQQGNRWERMTANWMLRVEARAPHVYTDILACAEEDQQYFRTQASAKQIIPVVRNGVDAAAYVADPQERTVLRAKLGLSDDDHVLMFAGSGFGPNVEALAWLRQFCSREREFLISNRLVILVVGSVSTPLREGPLLATGRVERIFPYFAASDAGLNPVIRGSGANVKLFEYLAARLPVISTNFGVRGSRLVVDRDYLEYEGDGLKDVLRRFVQERDRAAWQVWAEQVWLRHRSDFDAEEIMRDVTRQLPDFSPAAG